MPERNSGVTSPVPVTRVEKVDSEPSYGEVPGTAAYNMREHDAQPDEIAVVPDTEQSSHSSDSEGPSSTPGGQPIPSTMVEKIDPSEPSHGTVPGTLAHEKRAADAVPDMVVKSGSPSPNRSRSNTTPGDLPIPLTRVEKVDSEPSYGEVPGTRAFELRKGDSQPDVVEEVGDAPGKNVHISYTSERLTESESPTAIRSPKVSHARRKSSAAGRKGLPVDYDEEEDGSDGGFGDDFDDFEEGEEDAEFGDFDDGFMEPATAHLPPIQSLPVTPATPSFVSRNLYHDDDILSMFSAMRTC